MTVSNQMPDARCRMGCGEHGHVSVCENNPVRAYFFAQYGNHGDLNEYQQRKTIEFATNWEHSQTSSLRSQLALAKQEIERLKGERDDARIQAAHCSLQCMAAESRNRELRDALTPATRKEGVTGDWYCYCETCCSAHTLIAQENSHD